MFLDENRRSLALDGADSSKRRRGNVRSPIMTVTDPTKRPVRFYYESHSLKKVSPREPAEKNTCARLTNKALFEIKTNL